jgi:hypothetical protein
MLTSEEISVAQDAYMEGLCLLWGNEVMEIYLLLINAHAASEGDFNPYNTPLYGDGVCGWEGNGYGSGLVLTDLRGALGEGDVGRYGNGSGNGHNARHLDERRCFDKTGDLWTVLPFLRRLNPMRP